jgi:TRAP-type C4-dicarboxylate transport system permease small subunit
MERFISAVRLVSQVCGVIAGALIASGVAIVCQMVFVRYVLNQTTIWQTDFVTYSLVAATFVGSPYVLMTRGHVNVDILPHYVNQRARFRLAVVAALTTLAFALAMTILTSQFWYEAWDNRWVSDTMWRARLWIPYSSMPIGLGLLSLQSLADLMSLLSGREPPFGMTPRQEDAA